MAIDKEKSRARVRELASNAYKAHQPTGWFEPLYQEAKHGKLHVPWDDGYPNPFLMRWLNAHYPEGGQGARALEVGCGLGRHAQELAKLGFDVTAFDLSSSAIDMARERAGNTNNIRFVVGDILKPPIEWRHAFDLVVEVYTLQALPADLRLKAASNIANAVSALGNLVLIARGREPDEPLGDLPWPLTKDEVVALEDEGLKLVEFEDVIDDETPPQRRFIATFHRV